MIKLGTLYPELQRVADEMAADNAPPDIRGLSPSQLAAELEARGIEPTTDREQERRRKQEKRRQARRWEKKRRRG